MKQLFYAGIAGLILFEIGKVFFIMPLPGSQEINTINIAYFLHSWQLLFRIFFTIMIVFGFKSALTSSGWIPYAALLCLIVVFYMTNFKMAADTMFYQPSKLLFADTSNNVVEKDRLILGIEYLGEKKAYPVQFLGYHHQVRDTLGGSPVMVTYCTVCRTGRVFLPIVNGKTETFRLVGMDHYNAMFEDKSTGSWWRQATGEALIGPLKGIILPELPYVQTTLEKWVELNPYTLIMQADPKYQTKYDSMQSYEAGKLTGKLTRRDTSSWEQKSWVVGLTVGNESKAYDWNRLQKERLIFDVLDNQALMVVLSQDNKSFIVLSRPESSMTFTLLKDTLISDIGQYDFFGRSIVKSTPDLLKLNAYQEYWHSWQFFHPDTKKY